MTMHINGKQPAANPALNELTLGSLEKAPEASDRFYPEQLPAFEFEPTRDRFNIVALGENVGEAVVCLREFAAGEVVFACTGFFSSSVTLFSLQITPTLHLHDPYFYGKLMHSCDPNVRVDVTTRQFIATRAIRAGEPVTLDYAASEDYLFRNFPCRCGAAQCRGIVAGRKQNLA